MNQPEAAKRTLQQCSDAGMHISIDDFGRLFIPKLSALLSDQHA